MPLTDSQKAMFANLQGRWTKKTLHSLEGDHEAIIYTNKKDPELTVELHPLDNSDTKEESEPFYNDWMIFEAIKGKGVPSSPEVLSESGGETRADALLALKKELIETDEANK